ncbi:OmpP1/FadL family transporter [Marinibactrum halimedae]|uniref:Long-chain fatty acid transporter n=1 Tax=Marinibactrum halimedae TaxID=1444977 RepID=A0AA37T4P3_9GAMM|nr:outer membrane protein transport protein [Marinibactrum halimedae]MCD9458305.1 outer membrane protein transport protein [Marinibactrum halimedae]GLS27068.1 long-chain fatty acid transporter [Marinibactrum halimedae]
MKLKTFAVCALSLATTQAIAAGFQLQEHSAVGLGRAFAGEAAMTDNASTISHNPALSGFFSTSQISAGFSYIDPEIDVNGTVSNPTVDQIAGNPSPGTEREARGEDIAPTAVVPNAYYIRPLNDQLSFGMIVNSNFGLSTDYDDDFAALDTADFAEIVTVNFSPTLSFKPDEKVSIGFGINIVYGDGTLENSFPVYESTVLSGVGAQIGAELPNNTVVKLEGDDWGFGWNAGIALKPTDALTLGFSYRSEVDLELEGDVSTDLENLSSLSVVPGLEGFAAYAQSAILDDGGTLDITLPAVTEFAAAYQVGQLTISGNATLTEWHVFEELAVTTDAGFTRVLAEENWNNAWRYAIGVGYEVSQALTLRAGFALDESPVPAEHRSLAIPDSDREWYSLGATYTMSQNVSFDFGYSFVSGEDVFVDAEETPLRNSFEGTSGGDAHIFAASVNYSF